MKTTDRKFFILILLLSQLGWMSCKIESIEQSYYTFTGETVGSYLKDSKKDFSKFVRILERSNMYDQLTTYGEYTCFAPNNSAIDSLLVQRNLTSIEELSDAECDTISKTHLIEGLFYTTDLESDEIPGTNFLDRYLTYSTTSDSSSGTLKVAYFINKVAEMLVRDDSVENGVVHTINRVLTPSNLFIPQLILSDTTVSIFSSLLFQTGLDKKMEIYEDKRYKIGSDSIVIGSSVTSWPDQGRAAFYPDKRKYGFTAFVEPNYIYRNYGVRTAQDVIDKLLNKTGAFVMSDPNGRLKYDTNLKDSDNVVYRFVANHLMNCRGNYSQWNVTTTIRENCAIYDLLDPQDFYENMAHNMVKFQTTREGQLYINRRRVNEGAGAIRTAADPYQAAVRGVRVLTPTESGLTDPNALNGIYHYIDALLIYDATTKDALNTRMRMDAATLSPDFLNSPGRHRAQPNNQFPLVTRYKKGFVENFTFSDQTLMGLRADPEWSPSFQRNGLDFLGQYDFTVKVPPVPAGQYEVRLGMNAGNDRGIVQVYFDDEPCGIPIDMRIYKSDPKIGSVDDTEDLEENKRNDKDLKNRGYMKGPDSWKTSNLGDAGQLTLRRYFNSMRIILTTKNFVEGETHYLRFKSVIDNPRGIFPFDFLELCPKSVYGNVEGEDTH